MPRALGKISELVKEVLKMNNNQANQKEKQRKSRPTEAAECTGRTLFEKNILYSERNCLIVWCVAHAIKDTMGIHLRKIIVVLVASGRKQISSATGDLELDLNSVLCLLEHLVKSLCCFKKMG